MNIGTISPSTGGALVGRVSTLATSLTIALRPVQSTNERAPKYDILALTAAKAWIVVGALFELTSNASGEAFLQGKIDDPSLPAPLNVALFRQENGSYNVVWSRPKRTRDVPAARGAGEGMPPIPGMAAAGEADEPRAGDGLGESTAEYAS